MKALALLALVALPSVALPQSLGEAARQEAERRKKAQDERRGGASVVDEQALAKANEDRPKHATSDDAKTAATPADTTSRSSRQIDTQTDPRTGPAATTTGDLDRERAQRERDEKMWRERAASANARVEKARARYDAVKDASLAPGQAFVDRNGRVLVRSPEHLQRLVADAKADLDAAQKAFDELQESARRAGVPAGWMR